MGLPSQTLSLIGTSSFASNEDRAKRRVHAAVLTIVGTGTESRPTAGRLVLSMEGPLPIRIVVGRGEGCELRTQGDEIYLSIPDGWMSGQHFCLERDLDPASESGWTVRDLQSKNGLCIDGKAVKQGPLPLKSLLQAGASAFVLHHEHDLRATEPAVLWWKDLVHKPFVARSISPRNREVLALLERAATSTLPIILQGETGTGKELSARYVHALSERQGRFVAVNCGAISETIVESELFGHKKGAFSGASSDKEGLIQASDGGTLFLDEVAELPLGTQVALLRVLQEKEVTMVGSTRPIPIDLRVVCASHEDLEERVQQGRFRADLLARLEGVKVELLPLRERRVDLGILCRQILTKAFPDTPIALSNDAVLSLNSYPFLRNIRELESALNSAALWASEGRISAQHLPPGLLASSESDPERSIEQQLRKLLREHRGNVSAVARDMDKARVQIRRWCKKFAISPDEYRS